MLSQLWLLRAAAPEDGLKAPLCWLACNCWYACDNQSVCGLVCTEQSATCDGPRKPNEGQADVTGKQGGVMFSSAGKNATRGGADWCGDSASCASVFLTSCAKAVVEDAKPLRPKQRQHRHQQSQEPVQVWLASF